MTEGRITLRSDDGDSGRVAVEHLEGPWPLNLSEKELIDILLSDFEDYNNVLVRMAAELGGD